MNFCLISRELQLLPHLFAEDTLALQIFLLLFIPRLYNLYNKKNEEKKDEDFLDLTTTHINFIS